MELREPYEELAVQPTEWTSGMNFPPPEKIRILDTTLRDGEQTPGVAFTPHQKLELASMLSDLGVHIIDLGFPAAAPSERETLKLMLEAKKSGRLRPDLELLVMCRALQEDIDTAVEAFERIGMAPDEATFFIFTAGSDLHVKYKLGKMLLRQQGKGEDEWLDTPVQWYRDANRIMFADAIRHAIKRGVKIVEAGNAEDGSRADVEYIVELGRAAMEAGATRQAFPDTVGVFTPEGVRHYVSRLVEAFPGIDLVVHFHNDFDLATINTITAMSLGANIPTVTLGGIGERAGNTPLHSLLAALQKLYGITIPGIKYELIYDATRLASRLSGIPLQPHEPVVGTNVYAHESGIHAAGIVIEPRMYQFIKPDKFGAKRRWVFGKHSGTAVVEHVLRQHEQELQAAGVDLSKELVARVLLEVKRLREQQAALRHTEKLVDSIYERMLQLGISETELVELAKHLGADRESTAESFW
jgi:isopropylmalate/homocitrate/citramalate synthase